MAKILRYQKLWAVTRPPRNLYGTPPPPPHAHLWQSPTHTGMARPTEVRPRCPTAWCGDRCGCVRHALGMLALVEGSWEAFLTCPLWLMQIHDEAERRAKAPIAFR